MNAVAHLAPEGFEEELAAELGPGVIARHGRLFLARRPEREPSWVRNTWLELATAEVASIGEAAKLLRAIQRNWHPYAFHLHRRTQLLADKLPPIRFRPLRFPSPAPAAPLGAYAFLEKGTLLHSRSCSSPFPNGEIIFEEDHENPPSRAYLKLWDAFTRLGVHPGPGDRCIDLGSSPGGWTWVLATLGAEVHSVDRADLDPRVAAMPGVRFERGSAFAVDPRHVDEPYDWLFSDIICYPGRLLEMIERWRAAKAAKRFVCTLKFQGATDHAVTRRFAAIPGARVVHLFHNRHELTFLLA